jgi:hypothetical protein
VKCVRPQSAATGLLKVSIIAPTAYVKHVIRASHEYKFALLELKGGSISFSFKSLLPLFRRRFAVSLFYRASPKELVDLRNDVFKNRGMPALAQNGFVKSPFSSAWFGRDNAGGYIYEFCRVSEDSRLDMILVYINKGDSWVQLHLNIFRLHPIVKSIEQLKDIDGLQFHLPPNSRTLTRLAPARGIVLAGLPKHKVRFYFSKTGLNHRLDQLGKLIENDLINVDRFVHRWMQENSPLVTDWEGRAIKNGAANAN